MSSSSSSTSVVKVCPFHQYEAVSLPEEQLSRSVFKDMLRSSRGRNKGKGKSYDGLKPIRVKLWSVQLATTSAAATALAITSSIVLSTGNFPELSNFMVIYDELRMMKVKLHYHHLVPTPAASGSTVTTGAINIQFDPTATAPASISSALEESFNSGPLLIFPGVNGATNQSGSISMKYHTLSATVPKLAPITGGDCPGSAWIALDSATAPSMCVIGSYIQALGPSGVTSILYFVELDVELRLRT